MNANLESFAIGTKVESLDSYGYPVMPMCGVIVSHLGDGHAMIESFEGGFNSSVAYMSRIAEVETL